MTGKKPRPRASDSHPEGFRLLEPRIDRRSRVSDGACPEANSSLRRTLRVGTTQSDHWRHDPTERYPGRTPRAAARTASPRVRPKCLQLLQARRSLGSATLQTTHTVYDGHVRFAASHFFFEPPAGSHDDFRSAVRQWRRIVSNAFAVLRTTSAFLSIHGRMCRELPTLNMAQRS